MGHKALNYLMMHPSAKVWRQYTPNTSVRQKRFVVTKRICFTIDGFQMGH